MRAATCAPPRQARTVPALGPTRVGPAPRRYRTGQWWVADLSWVHAQPVAREGFGASRCPEEAVPAVLARERSETPVPPLRAGMSEAQLRRCSDPSNFHP